MRRFSNWILQNKRSRSPRQRKAFSFDILEARQLLATIARDLSEFNGLEFRDSSTQFPLPSVQVGTFNFSQELQKSTITSATISGTFGNSTVPHSSGVRILLDGIQIAETGSFSDGPPAAWSHTFSGPELAALQDGAAVLTAVQTSRVAIRLGPTHLEIGTVPASTPRSGQPTTPNQPSSPGTSLPLQPLPLTPGISNPTEVPHDREPGDIRRTAIDLGAITQPKFVEDRISNVNDIDFYRFTAVRGQIITFDIDAPGLDSYLKISARPSKRTIAFNNDGRSEEIEELLEPIGGNSFIRFVAPRDGTYFVAVSNFRYRIPYDPDTTNGRNLRSIPGDPETGAYRLTIRTPNIRSGAIRVEPSQRDSRNLTLTLTFEVRETNLDPRYPLTYSINNLGNATPIKLGFINQKDIKGIDIHSIGSHTVAFNIPASVLAGSTVKFLNLDPPYGRNERGVVIETNEFDNSFVVDGPEKPEECGPTIARPAPTSWSYTDWKRPSANLYDLWTMNVQVSQDEGLVLSNVRLGPRLMARKMSIPYFTLRVNGGPSQRGTLTPDSDNDSVRTRLTGYQIGIQDENGDRKNDINDPLVIKAIYAVDRISRGAMSDNSSCLTITQEYKFYQGNPNIKSFAGPHLDPFGEHGNSAEFMPIASYAFHSQGLDRLTSITIPQRFNFQVEGSPANSTAVTRDPNSRLSFEGIRAGVVGLRTLRNENPLKTEVRFTAISRGNPGQWDNYHQTNRSEVEQPVGITRTPPFYLVPPGAPEAVHIHWRWGNFLDFPAGRRGRPIIPSGSNQTVNIGIANARGTDRPMRWEDTINGDRTDGQDIVFWYVGTGFMSSDAFFTHGGFFENISGTFQGIA